jgi:hypothetical protein
MRSVHRFAKTAGVRTLFFWQPSIFERRNLNPFEERVRQLQPKEQADMCLRTYELAASVPASNPDLGIHDASHCFDDVSGPRFMDIFHLNEQGNAELASEIVKKLLPLIRPTDSPGKQSGDET